jgi:hypothetical protein
MKRVILAVLALLALAAPAFARTDAIQAPRSHDDRVQAP